MWRSENERISEQCSTPTARVVAFGPAINERWARSLVYRG